MPTLAQLVRRKQERRVKNGEKRTPALKNSPQKKVYAFVSIQKLRKNQTPQCEN